MALSQSSTCTQVSTLVHAELARPKSPKSQATPTKADVGSTVLRSAAGAKTRSMAAAVAAPAPPQASALALKSLPLEDEEAADDELVRQISDSFEDPSAAGMRVRRASGKNRVTRTSRRRALVMCLALGMVRPVTAAGGIRRTASSGLHRSASSGFTVSGGLASQVSIASSLKAANLLDDKEEESATL